MGVIIVSLCVTLLVVLCFAVTEKGRELLFEAPILSGAMAILHVFLWAGMMFLASPALTGPFWGVTGVIAFIECLAVFALCFHPLVLLLLLILPGIAVANSAMFHAHSYATMVGPMEARTWTQDTQAADPNHIRLIPLETAMQIARQQLSAGTGSIGSQFKIEDGDMHSQSINGRLWWVVPLDFNGFSSWSATDGSPGYVMVDAEDRAVPARFMRGFHMRYTPGAYFSTSLERHLWNHGFRGYDQAEPILEIDDQDRPWWVVAVTVPTMGWAGDRVQGAVIVNPETGAMQFHRLGQIPAWVDRVMPEGLVRGYLAQRGEYSGGWWNSMWAELNQTHPAGEESLFQFGANHEPYWVTQISSGSDTNTTMLELVYTHARTGANHVYRVQGGTEEAILDRVNSAVTFMHFHGTNPVFYNIHGTMTAVVPIVSESHAFQEVGLVSVVHTGMPVAHASTFPLALRQYEQLLAQNGADVSHAEESVRQERVTAAVTRIGVVSSGQEVVYAFEVQGHPGVVFTVSTALTPFIALTQVGDQVVFDYTPGQERTLTVTRFSNTPAEAH